MGFKRGMGYSPLGYDSDDKSEFSYVGDQSPRSGRSDSIFEDYEASNDFSLANSFSEKMKSQHVEAYEAEDRPEKKVASYYLEVETLDRLKKWADSTKASYSSIVEQAIQTHLSKVGI